MKKNRDLQQERGLYVGGWLLLAVFILFVAVRRIWGGAWFLPPCLVYKWTGYYCPGCGGTRAVQALLEGRFAASFFYHPVVLYGAVIYIWYMVSHSVACLSGGRAPIGLRYSDKYLYGAVIVILVQWVLKNAVKAIWGIDMI